MDSADPKTLHAAQGVRLFHHEEQLGLISHGVKELVGSQAELYPDTTADGSHAAIPHSPTDCSTDDVIHCRGSS